MHYNDHRLNKGTTTGARGGPARTTVPTNIALTTSATGKVKHLSTQPQDDNRSPSLLPWSMGYWPGTHHLWVGSLLCAQIPGVGNRSRRGLTVATLRVRCIIYVLQLVLYTIRRARSLTCETTEYTAVLGKPRTSRTTSAPLGAPRQPPPQPRRSLWCARRYSPHH